MVRDSELRRAIWMSLLQSLDDCQKTINLIEQLDAGTNALNAEWDELDQAFAHMHNVKRWIGRRWEMAGSPKAPGSAPLPPTTAVPPAGTVTRSDVSPGAGPHPGSTIRVPRDTEAHLSPARTGLWWGLRNGRAQGT